MLDTQKRWCHQSTASLLHPIVITTSWRRQHSCQYHPVLVRAETKLVSKDTTMQQHRDASLSDTVMRRLVQAESQSCSCGTQFSHSLSLVLLYLFWLLRHSLTVEPRLTTILIPQSPKCFLRQVLVQAEWPQAQQCWGWECGSEEDYFPC